MEIHEITKLKENWKRPYLDTWEALQKELGHPVHGSAHPCGPLYRARLP